nr:DUF3363 domain-containing protein [Paracidovorax cattleyae]
MYRQSVRLVSGRYVMLDEGKSFSLVPWRSVVEPKLGQRLTALVRGASADWNIGRQQALSI